MAVANKSKWKQWHKIVLVLFVVSCIISGIISNTEKKNIKETQIPKVELSEVIPVLESTPPFSQNVKPQFPNGPTLISKAKIDNTAKIEKTIPFNIPKLFRRDSAYINRSVGYPIERFIATSIQKYAKIDDQLTYQNGRYILDIEFNYKTKKAVTYMLTDTSLLITDYTILLMDNNLSENSLDYKIKPIKTLDRAHPDRKVYTGVYIIPSNQ